MCPVAPRESRNLPLVVMKEGGSYLLCSEQVSPGWYRSTQEIDVHGTRCWKCPPKIVGHSEHPSYYSCGTTSLLNEHFPYLLSKYHVIYFYLSGPLLQSWSHIGTCPYFSMFTSFILLQGSSLPLVLTSLPRQAKES